MGDSDRRIKVDNAVKEAIQCMISYNDSHDHLDQIFICPASLNKFFSDKEKVKPFNLEPCMFGYGVIVRVLESNTDLIDAHHKQHNLNSAHNAKMGNLKKYSKNNAVILGSSKQDNAKKKFSYFKPRTIAEEIEDRELTASISQDLAEKWKEYRELVQARKLEEAKSRKEPEVYHHFKKREN